MLGIRRYKGRTIDLWCGEADDFIAPENAHELSQGLEHVQNWHLALRPFDVDKSVDVEDLFQTLKAELDTLSRECPLERITIVADDQLRYQRLTELLYRHFEEAPWH